MPTNKTTTDCSEERGRCCSSIFRIEKLDDCCATCRVLIPNPEPTTTTELYLATDSFFTINLNCVCAIKCLNDSYVNL